jgi:hypothetical protein
MLLRDDHGGGAPGAPLAMELENFIRAARGREAPRVGGEEALRAMRLADQVLRSLEAHRWDAEPAATTTAAPRPPAEAGSVLQGPHAWRLKGLRPASHLSSH